MYNVRVHLAGEVLDALAQLFGHLRQAGVLLQPFEQLRDGLRGLCLTFADGNGQGLTVLYIGFHLGFPALPGVFAPGGSAARHRLPAG